VGGRLTREPRASRFVDENQYQGTRDVAAFLAVPAAIRFMQEHDWPAVRRRCHELVCYAREQVRALTGLPPATPDGREWFAQMGILPLPPCDTTALRGRLLDEYDIEIPLTSYDGQPFVRISVQGYNTREDVDALVRALGALLPEVVKERGG